MRLTYLDRASYRRKAEPAVIAALHNRSSVTFYLLPEGGSNALAARGCARSLPRRSRYRST